MFGLLVGSNLGKGVKNLRLGQICRQIAPPLCQRICGKSRQYRWDSSHLILGIFKSSNR